MRYFQTDFLVNPPLIAEKSVKLFLSSVPLAILDNGLALLFGLLNRLMRDDGWILIDAPAGYQPYQINLYHAGMLTGWKDGYKHIVPNHYKTGETQIIFVCYQHDSEKKVPLPKHDLVVRRTQPMSHPCEFCPNLISELIMAYTEPNDIVLDAFCGTGIVPGEADRLGRIGIGADQRPVANIREEYICNCTHPPTSSGII